MKLLGKAMDKEFWAEVREKDCFKKYRDELFDLWAKHVENGPIMNLSYAKFKLFWTTGDRSQYERTYFTRRLALDCSALLSNLAKKSSLPLKFSLINLTKFSVSSIFTSHLLYLLINNYSL